MVNVRIRLNTLDIKMPCKLQRTMCRSVSSTDTSVSIKELERLVVDYVGTGLNIKFPYCWAQTNNPIVVKVYSYTK